MILLSVQEITVSFSRALRIILSGLFFNLFLLGSTGGDVIKIFFIMRETPDKKAGALLSVFIDRVVGVLALAVVSAVVILARWGELWNSARMGVLTVALILGGSLGFIFAAWLVDRLNLTSKLPHWLPMHDKMVEAAAAFSQYAKAGGAVGKAFLLSLPAHLLNFSTFYFAAKAFGAGLSLIGVFCVMPIVSTVTALPISLERRNSLASAASGSPPSTLPVAGSRRPSRGARTDARQRRRSMPAAPPPAPSSLTISTSPETTSATTPLNEPVDLAAAPAGGDQFFHTPARRALAALSASRRAATAEGDGSIERPHSAARANPALTRARAMSPSPPEAAAMTEAAEEGAEEEADAEAAAGPGGTETDATRLPCLSTPSSVTAASRWRSLDSEKWRATGA